MKTRVLFTIVFLALFSSSSLLAQNEVVMTIDNQEVKKSEFEYIFKKNNKNEAITKVDLDEYLELFVNFKLKVREAEMLGMDTMKKFIDELRGYQKQLERPYLIDNEMIDELMQEAYDRLKVEVRASHILIKSAKGDAPEDTLKAYNAINKLRERVIAGENFESVAKGKGGSQDPTVMKNGGDLGYFSGFDMVYPFESAAYKTEVGEISEVLRTRYGYHILKVTDKRPARGRIRTAHIMVKLSDQLNQAEQANAEKKINEIYEKLISGDDFAALAKQYSDDKGSGSKGGELPWFKTGKMVPEFENVAYALKKDGDISKPFTTTFGWHIVKRLELEPVKTFSEVKTELKNKISRDSRAKITRNSFLEKLKKEYDFSIAKKGFKPFDKYLDTSVFNASWSMEKPKKFMNPLFSFAGKEYLQKDFAEYLIKNQMIQDHQELKKYTGDKFKRYTDALLMEYERSQLTTKYPEFKALLKEYRDGILLFELTDQKVWSRAMQDSIGLEQFYQNNKSQYMWKQRAEVTIYTCANEKIAKKVKKMLKKGRTDIEIKQVVNTNSELNLTVESNKFERGDNKKLDLFDWKTGLSKPKEMNGQVVFVDIQAVVAPTHKELSEARGSVIGDYQTYLEKEWIKELRAKYAVEVNEDVLYSVK